MYNQGDMPTWWKQAVTIEYLPCRDFRKGDRIGHIDLSLVSSDQVEAAANAHRIVAYGTLIHNVNITTFQARNMLNLVSPIVMPLVDGDRSAIIPHGLVSKYHFPWLINEINVADPIETFQAHVQVLDQGVLYQWEVARFEGVAGRTYGRWVSDHVDLSEFDNAHDEFQELMTLKRSLSADEYERRATSYIDSLKDRRARAFTVLLEAHGELKKAAGRSRAKVVAFEPPPLSHFETMKIEQGEMSIKASMSPVFYRAALQHSYKANDLTKLTHNVSIHIADQIYGERAEAVIMTTACLESVVNEVGYQKYDDVWTGLEKLSVEDKFRILFKLAGKASDYDRSRDPFQALGMVVSARNEMIHFKPKYRRVIDRNNFCTSPLERFLNDDLVTSIPNVLRDLIERVFSASDLSVPGWLDDKPGWKVSREH